jgi:hypothetical protein
MGADQATTPARVIGVLPQKELEHTLLDRRNARVAKRNAHQNATRRMICAGRNHKGHPCRLKLEPGRNRCKFYGGKSAGLKRAEGKARIAAA